KKHDKVLVVHSRPQQGSNELYQDMLALFEEEKVREMRFEIHSYTHTPEFFKKFLDLGAYVSFNGIVTFDKTGNMKKLVELAPPDRILLETDCPYLTPIPHRGQRNEPAYVRYVAEKVAEIKNIPAEEVARLTTANAKKLFRLP
ncbi:MAG TPA: TatD family hydrolase, partial [Patescibacteria group bacterium]|nr:TatD family hydrolase [Patescibacteria group bacterium]